MKILIISEFFAPVRAVASIRWTKLSKYLVKEKGCTVDLLTNAKDFDGSDKFLTKYEYDETLKDDLNYIHTICSVDEPLMAKAANCMHRIYASTIKSKANAAVTRANDGVLQQRQKKSLKSRLYDIFMKAKNNPRGKKAAKAAIDWASYDVIVSSYGPKWVHLAAESIKKRYQDIIWVADYRDTLAFSADTTIRENIDFPRRHTNLADLVSYVAPNVEELGLPERQRWLYLNNGFDPDEKSLRRRRSEDRFYISITGTMYETQSYRSDLAPLMRALTDLIDGGLIERADVEVRFCGNRGYLFEKQTRGYDSVRTDNLGFVARDEALRIQDSSSILVLPTWNAPNSQGNLSGRVYEYLSAAVPILGLCSGSLSGSALKEMIDRARAGFCYEEASAEEDYSRLKEFILRLYRQWKQEGLTDCDIDEGYIASFGYDALAHKLYTELNLIMKQNS